MITEQLGALGAWSVTLVDDTPRSVSDQLGFFGHIGIWRGRVDVEQADDATLLASARYVGVLREKPTGRCSLEGSGMVLWLGDEDGKGAVLETPVVFTDASLTTCVTTLLPPAVTVGTIHDPGGTYTGTHQWQTPRDVLDTITTAFGVEYRVNGDGSIDVGTQAQLYGTTPSTVISARGAGTDFDLTSLGADFSTDTAVIDYTSRVVLLGQKTDDTGASTSFVEATADAATLPYKDLHGNTVRITRTVSDSGQTDASAPAAAQLQLNLYNRTKRALMITATDYDMSGQPILGQNAYVFDPDNGLYDPATQVDFRGELIFPTVVRISALQWPVTDGMTVAFRTQDGAWVDLTRWVAWESQSESITVGDLPRTLTTSSNPVLDQTQSAPDASTPNPPTGLALTTTSVESSKGQSTATITASWSAPTQNTDGSVITDLSYYVVRYRWQGRAPQWDTRQTGLTTIDIPGLAVGLVYDVEVAAVDTTGHVSAFTGVQSITAAPDQNAPNPPSDPVVGAYLGQLKITWDGKDNTGAAMPPDFAVVEVHVSDTSGFTPDSSPGSATLVSQLSTAGQAYVSTPYGATRYVKLVAVDNSLNRSAPSNQVSGSSAWINTPDYANLSITDAQVANLSVGKLTAGTMSADVTVSGRIATALTGARTEMNSLGFQKFASDGVTKLIDFTGATNLLTGTLQTALSGRRLVSGAAGLSGAIQFIAPDGTTSTLTSSALSGGAEGFSMSLPIAGTHQFWNTFRVDTTELAFIDSKNVHFGFGGATGNGGDFRVSFATSKGNATTQPVLSDRFVVTETWTSFRDSAGNTRLYLTDAGAITAFRSPGQNFAVWEIAADLSTSSRFRIEDNLVWFQWPTGAWRITLSQGPGGDAGASVQSINQYNYGATICGVAGSDGKNHRFQMQDATQSTFIPAWASAFVVQSAREVKVGIAPAPAGALARVRALKPRRYRRVGPLDAAGKRRAPDGPPEIGLVVDEVHAEVMALDNDGTPVGVNLYSLAVEVLAALQELAADVDRLKGAAA